MKSVAVNFGLNIEGPQLPKWWKRSLVTAVMISIMIHIVVLVIKKPETPIQDKHLKAPLAVVIVNSQSSVSPVKPKRLAQHDLNGGGLEETPERASAIAPMLPGLAEKLNQLQEEQNRLLSSLREDGSRRNKNAQGKAKLEKESVDPLEAELAKRIKMESERPRKATFTSTSAKSVIYAEYYNSLRNKVEAYGTTYFPRLNGTPLYGSLIMMASIDREGKLVSKPTIERSSGNPELDRQTLAILQACAPFEKFPANVRSQLDVIDWIATFSFVQGSDTSQLELRMSPAK
jgi:protein TonB